MTNRVMAFSLAVAMFIALGWMGVALADEPAAPATSRDGAGAAADDPLAEVAEQRSKPRVKDALTKKQPISITFKYGDEDPSLTCNVIDDRPITAATTVGSVLSKAASATTIFRPADSIISVIRPQTVVGDDLNLKVIKETLRVEWDLVSNRPTEASNYKLQPGDRIIVWQPAPAPGQGFIKLAPKAPPAGVWTPTIPPPAETDPFRASAVSYVTKSSAPAVPAPPTVLADPPFEAIAKQRPADGNDDAGFRFPSAALSSPPWPASAASGLPFFGQFFVTPDPIKFRELTEQVSLPNGQVQAVKRHVPTARPWMTFTIRFITDSSGSLELFSPIEKTGQMVADSESLIGTMRILETNKLISPIDGKTAIGQELSPLISGGSRSEKMVLDEVTGQPRPGEVTDWFIDIMPTDLRGQLHVSIKLQYVLNGRTWEASPTAEIGRGQSLLARLKPLTDKGPAKHKRDDARRYILLTPEVGPTPEPGPIPFAAPPAALPVTPDEVTSVAAVPIPTTVPPVATVSPVVAAALPVREGAEEPPKSQIRFNAVVVEDISGSLAEFMPPPSQPPFETVDSATLGAALRILLKEDLVRRYMKAPMVGRSGLQAEAGIRNDELGDIRLEALGEVQRGGMSVELKVRRTVDGQKSDASYAMLVADGQSIIARIEPKAAKKTAGDPGSRGANGDKKPGLHPVYIILSPEVAPL